MADEADLASHQEAVALQRALADQAANAKRTPGLDAIGVCHNIRCGQDFAQGDSRIFCDSRCAAEHHRLSKLANEAP